MSAFSTRAMAVLPGGVNSPVRAWGAVGGEPVPIVSAAGSRLRDARGHELIDLIGAWGPAILGHAHPEVVEAVEQAARRGLGFGATTEAEIDLAEQIRARYAPAEKVRLVSSGTEAAMTALRLARAATGRDVILKFDGCYHGHVDALLTQAGSGLATFGIATSAGVPASEIEHTIVLPYGDAAAVTDAFAQHGERIAAVITEAAAANMGVIAPPPGFNAHLTATAHSYGSLLIADEVLTGFRAGPQGWWGIEQDQALAAGGQTWTPDLVMFGKVIGGGLPLAAVGGRHELMDLLAPTGRVYQAGTLSGNPVAVAAGLATLRALTADVYAGLSARADAVEQGVSRALTESGVSHAIGRAGTLLSVFLGSAQPPTDFAQARGQDVAAFTTLFHHMYQAGVALPPSAFEAWFLSAAHTDQDIVHIIDAVANWARRGA